MGFYSDHIEPRIVSCVCGMANVAKERAQIVPEAAGRVLEIGYGSGHNAPYYASGQIGHLYALEPNAGWRRLGDARLKSLPFGTEWLDLPGEEIPLPDDSVDTVLATFCLCTIAGVEAALSGMRRVLKPRGRLVFLEHGRAPDAGVARWQDRLNGPWSALAGGCQLNREPDKLIRNAGFRIDKLDQHYAHGTPKFAGFLSAGVAVK